MESTESHDTEPILAGHLQKLLEWILFFPSPLTPIFQSELSTVDVIKLSQVCRAWRAHLIPRVSEAAEDGDIEWHPLVRTLAVGKLKPQQERHLFVYKLMRGHIYKNGTVLRGRRISNPDHGVNLDFFRGVFGGNYLQAVTKICLDGTRIGPNAKDRTRLAWVMKCKNLVSLSLRWCSSIKIHHIAGAFLGEEQYYSLPQNIDAEYSMIPPKFETLMFWGLSGIWKEKDSSLNSERCDKLMKRYKTDLEWCSGKDHLGEELAMKQLIDAGNHRCGVCKTVQRANCISCDIKNICEGCSGFICSECLIIQSIAPTGGRYEYTFSGSTDDQDMDLGCVKPPNMLQYFCYSARFCSWRRKRHYFHPSCVPLSRKLPPDDIQSQRVCPGCGIYICIYGSELCDSCKAGQHCCWKDGVFPLTRAGYGLCNNCGRYFGNNLAREAFS
ncbi:hypothetical protein TWF730_011309 [Orbilia blumenaviensis]|uniref:F-box domain-containing protein n=1 Tax=Orbilia blumenaviensis TaxID=1796055 RepID=A0AAV9UNF8_9PEZI